MRSDEVTLAEVLKENGTPQDASANGIMDDIIPSIRTGRALMNSSDSPWGISGYYFDAWFLHNDEEETIVRDIQVTILPVRLLISWNETRITLFYVTYPYNVPHSPFQVPEKYFSKYSRQASIQHSPASMEWWRTWTHNIGLILEKLEELNIAENTIVIFLSDNGPNTDRYNGGMKGRKGSVDEGGVRVPFYIKWAGTHKTSEQLISWHRI